MECIGLGQEGYHLENGDPFVVTWHVVNVTNLIIPTESLTVANIEVTHAKNESSMIMDRSGTRTSVVLHKFAKVPWLKLRRDDTVRDSDLRIAALGTRPMATEEIDAEEERQTRMRKKKGTLGMDETMEVRKSHASASSGARGSTDPIPRPVETSRAQRSTPDLVLWSDEPGGLLEPAQEERKARGKSVPIGPTAAEKATHELTHTFPKLVAATACEPEPQTIHITDNPHKEPEFLIIMADYCFVQDAPGKELFTILDMLDVALGMMAAISVEEKGPATYVVSAVVEHLRAW